MRSTFMGIETAKRSLFTQQAALQTTGHNIANASTDGYSRQRVNMQASRPIEAPGWMNTSIPGQIGTGVQFNSITRIREKFLDDQFRNENKELGNWSIQADTLEKLEKVFNEPSDSGIRTVIDRFWQAWSDLSKDPERSDGRKIVREAAIALTEAFNSTGRKLGDLHDDLGENLRVKANEMTSLGKTISNLNAEIRRIETMGDNANDLRDQRDLLTDQLSKIVNITVQETDTGYNISMGGTSLVAGDTFTEVSSDLLNGAFNQDLRSGEAYGMIAAQGHVRSYTDELNKMVNTIIDGEITVQIPNGSVLPEGAVVYIDGVATTLNGANREINLPGKAVTMTVKGFNGLHKLGYLLKEPLTQAGDFFEPGGITAVSFQISGSIQADPNNIATSLRTTGTTPGSQVVKGNNSLALLIANLKDTKFEFTPGVPDSAVRFDDYYRSVMGQLGIQAQEANRQLTNENVLVQQVESQRQSVSGVSLDEEMANMIKFQHSYNAAARFMTTIDETLDKVINGMGVVGR